MEASRTVAAAGVLSWLLLPGAPLARGGPAEDAQRALDSAAKSMAQGTPAGREQARQTLRGTLEGSRRSGDKAIESRAAALTGNTYNADNEPRLAIQWYERSRLAAQTAGDERQRIRAQHNIAVQRWILGDAARALEEYRGLLPARLATNDQPGLGYTWLGIAAAQYSLGDTAGALDGYRRALVIWTAAGDAGNQAQSRSSLGLILDELGDQTGARREYEEALALWRKAKLPAGEGMTLNNLCLWSIGRRDYREAIGFCERALPLLEAAGDRRGRAYVWHNLGSARAGAGDHRGAVEQFERALAAKREIGDRWGEAASLQAAGESLIAMGTAGPGRARVVEALQLRQAVGDRAGQTQTLGVLARLHRDAGELPAALARIQSAVARIETTRSSLASQDRRASYFAGRRDYYELEADILVRLGRHGEAIEVAGRARGRQLLDRLADSLAGLQRDIHPALAARRRELEGRLHARSERLQRLDAGAKVAERRAALAEVDALLAESQELEERIRRASPRLATLTQPPLVRFAEVRRLLGPGDALLQIMAGRERSHAWFVTATGLKHAVLPARAELEKCTRAMFEAVSARAKVEAESEELARVLLGPFQGSMAPVRRLLIAADGAVESVPFAALAPGLEVVQVLSIPASTMLRSERARRAAPPRPLAIIADPVFSNPLAGAPAQPGDLPRLRFSRIEAERVAAAAKGWGPAAMALEFEASRAWLDRTPLKDFRIIHFATHALANTSRAALSGVQLARYDASGKAVDGFLRLPEIYGLELRAQLVVLSACRSAAGAELPGEGLVSLTRGFLYAGAAAVVATLWDVDDRATAELMQRFYEGLAGRRRSPGQALQEAQAAVRADPRWQHPYYWAGVTLHGEWR